MATRTQASISVILAFGTSVLAGVAVLGAESGSQKQYTGVVTAASVTPLNFQSSGTVENVMVHPGQVVNQGEILATQSTVQARVQLAGARAALTNDQSIQVADQAAVTADQAKVNGDLAPQVQAAQAQQDQLQVTKAQYQVSQAQQQAANSATVDQQNIDQVNAVMQSDQSKLSADTATYAEQCLTSPPPSFTQTQCDALKAQTASDQSTLTDQQGLATSVQAQASQTAAQDAGAVSQAQISLQMAQGLEAVQAAPSTSSTVADAQAAMARDQAQVVRDKATISKDQEAVQTALLALYQLAVTAPFRAVVLAVNGQGGALADQSGRAPLRRLVGHGRGPAGRRPLLPPPAHPPVGGIGTGVQQHAAAHRDPGRHRMDGHVAGARDVVERVPAGRSCHRLHPVRRGDRREGRGVGDPNPSRSCRTGPPGTTWWSVSPVDCRSRSCRA